MTPNNLRPADTSRNEDEATVEQPRDHRVLLSITADDFDELKSLVPTIEERLDRQVVPIGTAAYHVFRRGLELEREAA